MKYLAVDIDTCSSGPVQAVFSSSRSDDPETECCEVVSISQLTQDCDEIFLLKALERGLDYDDSIYQVINWDIDRIVNGTYVDFYQNDWKAYQEYFHDAYCSAPVIHGTLVYFPIGVVPCGHYRVTYTKGFYVHGDPDPFWCDQDIDPNISYLP